MNVMQKPGPDLPYGTVPGPRAQMVRLFLISTYTWQEDVTKKNQSAGATRNVNPALE